MISFVVMTDVTDSNELSLKKKTTIEAYKKALGNITKVCEVIGMARKTFYEWLKNDPQFKQAIDDIEPNELIADKAEHALMKKIDEGDTTAIIFTCKTKAKHRGYIERQEVVQTNTSLEELLGKSEE